MSFISLNVDLSDIARELAEAPRKLAYVLNEMADRCDGTPDDNTIEELIEEFDKATMGMIGIIAAAIASKVQP